METFWTVYWWAGAIALGITIYWVIKFIAGVINGYVKHVRRDRKFHLEKQSQGWPDNVVLDTLKLATDERKTPFEVFPFVVAFYKKKGYLPQDFNPNGLGH